jgi:hypothetical protein
MSQILKIEKDVLRLCADQYLNHYKGISALEVSRELNIPHEDTLNILRSLAAENQGKLKEPVELYNIQLKGGYTTSEEFVITGMFFPCESVLESRFNERGLYKAGHGYYQTRLMLGWGQYQLVYFNAEVLKKYQSHGNLYALDDTCNGGLIRDAQGTGDHIGLEIRFAKRELEDGLTVIGAILKDIAFLDVKHQSHWHSYEIENPIFGKIDPHFGGFVSRCFGGNWEPWDDPLGAVTREILTIQSIENCTELFHRSDNHDARFPVEQTHKSFCDCCSELYKLVGPDNLHIGTLKTILTLAFGCNDSDFEHKETGRSLSSMQLIKLLEKEKSNQFSEVVKELSGFRVEADHKILSAATQEDSDYLVKFADLTKRVVGGLTCLRNLLCDAMTRISKS